MFQEGLYTFRISLNRSFKEFSGGFVEGLWLYEDFVECLVEAYESTPRCGPVVWVMRKGGGGGGGVGGGGWRG